MGRVISRQVGLDCIWKVAGQVRGNKPESSVLLLFMSQVPVLGSCLGFSVPSKMRLALSSSSSFGHGVSQSNRIASENTHIPKSRHTDSQIWELI